MQELNWPDKGVSVNKAGGLNLCCTFESAEMLKLSYTPPQIN